MFHIIEHIKLKYFQRRKALQKDKKGTCERAVTEDLKFNLISLIIELGNPRHGLDKMFGLGHSGLYDRFFSKKSVRKMACLSLSRSSASLCDLVFLNRYIDIRDSYV